MRKFISILLALVIGMMTFASCSSCSNGDQFGIAYALQSEGKTDGSFTLHVAVADFAVTGDANYTFDLSSDKVQALLESKNVQSLEQAMLSKDASVSETAKEVNSWLDDAVKVTSFDGHYDIWVRGYVMETFTGLKFEIDKHFTNYPPNAEK